MFIFTKKAVMLKKTIVTNDIRAQNANAAVVMLTDARLQRNKNIFISRISVVLSKCLLLMILIPWDNTNWTLWKTSDC